MPLNYATVTGTFDDGQGQPVTGSATFTPSATLYASGVPVVTPDSPVQAQILSGQLLNAAGGPLQLLATDNAGITIEGQTSFWFWTVKIQIGGSAAEPWSFFLPHTPSPVDLFSLSGGGTGGGFANPMTTAGDMIYESAAPAPARLPVGAAGQALTVVAGLPAWSRGTLQPWQFYCPIQGSGSDDAAPISAQLAAAITYALNHQAYAELVFDAGAYLMKAAPTIGGSFHGNAIIPVLQQSVTAVKPVIALMGAGHGAAPSFVHWLQTVPQAAGTVFACARTDGTNDGVNGPASIIGGGFAGYGGDNGLFSNIKLVARSIVFQVPYNSTYAGLDGFGLAQLDVEDIGYMPVGTVAASAFASITNPNSITNQWTFGVRMPCTGNNDWSYARRVASYAATWGFMPSEHTDFSEIVSNYCIIGVGPYSGNGVTMPHAARGGYVSAEACTQAIGGVDGLARFDIACLDSESTTNIVFDPSGHLQGSVGVRGDIGAGYTTSGIYSAGTGLGVKLRNLNNTPGPVASPQAPPASGSPWVNGYYLDAWITLKTTGSISAISIDGVAQLIVAGAFQQIFVPGGHSYTPAYTGVLSHDVTLAGP